MAAEDIPLRSLNISSEETEPISFASASSSGLESEIDATLRQTEDAKENEVFPVICFSEVVDDVNLHFQIIRLPRQVYVWVGCNSAKLGNMYAAAPIIPRNAVSVTSLLGGTSDNISSGIAQRLAMKSGVSVILSTNIPKNNIVLEVKAEKKLVEKFIELGYVHKR